MNKAENIGAHVVPPTLRRPLAYDAKFVSRMAIALVTSAALIVSNRAAADPATGDADTLVLRPNHISCNDERDIARLASVAEDEAFRTTIVGLVYAGRCAAISRPVKIVRPTRKQSTTGSAYYCFRTVDYEREGSELIEIVESTPTCNIDRYITTLGELIAERSGEFSIVSRGPSHAVAVCNEGGRVVLRFDAGTVYRTSYVLPGTFREDVPAETDVASAFRNGCKGVDSVLSSRGDG